MGACFLFTIFVWLHLFQNTFTSCDTVLTNKFITAFENNFVLLKHKEIKIIKTRYDINFFQWKLRCCSFKISHRADTLLRILLLNDIIIFKKKIKIFKISNQNRLFSVHHGVRPMSDLKRATSQLWLENKITVFVKLLDPPLIENGCSRNRLPGFP